MRNIQLALLMILACPVPACEGQGTSVGRDGAVADAAGESSDAAAPPLTGSSTLRTVAGVELHYNGDEIDAREATLYRPRGVAVDSQGRIYIGDTDNHRVRVVKDGVIYPFAGTGLQGETLGDGGPAVEASLSKPTDVAIGPNDEVYILDWSHRRIRMVDPATGMISTVVGTGTDVLDTRNDIVATQTHLRPSGMDIGPDGAMYIAEFANNRVRRVSPGPDRRVSTIASNLSGPEAVALSPDGTYLYIAEGSSYTVRRLQLQTLARSLFAGTPGQQGTAGDNGLATEATLDSLAGLAVAPDGTLYIAQRWNHRIRTVDPSTGIIRRFAGTGDAGFAGDGGLATQAWLGGPSGVTVAGGALYVADTHSSAIRRISQDGSQWRISTVAGTGSEEHSGDGGPATSAMLARPQDVTINADGSYYIAAGHRIRKVAPDGTITTVAGSGNIGLADHDNAAADTAMLHEPAAVAVAADGTLYIADAQNHAIRKVTPNGALATIAGTGERGHRDGPGRAAMLAIPTDVLLAPDGSLFIADQMNHVIRRLHNDELTTVAGTPEVAGYADGDAGEALFNRPIKLAPGPNNSLYVADLYNHCIRQVVLTDAGTAVVSTVLGTCGEAGMSDDGTPVAEARLRFPLEVEVTPSGRLYFAEGGLFNYGAHHVRWVDWAEQRIYTMAGGDYGFNGEQGPASSIQFRIPIGLAAAPDGSALYIADHFNHRIRMVE